MTQITSILRCSCTWGFSPCLTPGAVLTDCFILCAFDMGTASERPIAKRGSDRILPHGTQDLARLWTRACGTSPQLFLFSPEHPETHQDQGHSHPFTSDSFSARHDSFSARPGGERTARLRHHREREFSGSFLCCNKPDRGRYCRLAAIDSGRSETTE